MQIMAQFALVWGSSTPQRNPAASGLCTPLGPFSTLPYPSTASLQKEKEQGRLNAGVARARPGKSPYNSLWSELSYIGHN